MALAAAVAFTSRTTILVFSNAYHGGTLSFPSSQLSTSRTPTLTTNLPHSFVIAPYNDIAKTASILAALPPNSLAAILVEPMLGSGGCIPGTSSFLKYLRTTATELGALLIVDEVMTSRLAPHGLSAELDLRPDLLTLGKWIGGSMTFGAFGGRKDIMALFDPREGLLAHSGTFNNNVVTMAAGITGLDIMTPESIAGLNALGEKLRRGIEEILRKNDIVETSAARLAPSSSKVDQEKELESELQETLESLELESPFTGTQTATSARELDLVRQKSRELSQFAGDKDKSGKRPCMSVSGRGSMLCVHFAGDSEKSLRALFWHHLLADGIYIAQRGFVALNLEIRQADVEAFLASVERFVSAYLGRKA